MKEPEFDIKVFTEEPENWEGEVCLDTLAKLVLKYEILPEIKKENGALNEESSLLE